MRNTKVQQFVGTAILATMVIILQIIASFVTFGPFAITLALIPIIIGAVVYGPKSGAVLGGAFGVVVCIMVVSGKDIGGHMMFQLHPIITLTVCMLKGILAGYLAGLVSRALSKCKKNNLGTILASIICPICNTLILSVAMLTIFGELVNSWALGEGYTSTIKYIILVVLGTNFLLEFSINIIFSPIIIRIINAVKK